MKMNQRYRILRHLKDHGSITNAEAFYEYGIGHLASRISEMRADGIPITGETVGDKNRYGEPVTYTRYSLDPETLQSWYEGILYENMVREKDLQRLRRVQDYIDFFKWMRVCGGGAGA